MPAKRGAKFTLTVQVLPSMTLPVQVLPLARVKSRSGAPNVHTGICPRVPLAVTLKVNVRVALHGAGVVCLAGQTFTVPKFTDGLVPAKVTVCATSAVGVRHRSKLTSSIKQRLMKVDMQ